MWQLNVPKLAKGISVRKVTSVVFVVQNIASGKSCKRWLLWGDRYESVVSHGCLCYIWEPFCLSAVRM